ncbi:hypothetical protein JTB14_035874 [Gonioctena quinquepunctata]|nr:hypothetical protein JTB14_035874 [Gonioctena quinquepunctata]
MTPGHVGKPLTIYDIAQLMGKALPLAFTASNIMRGFESTGFYPVNEDILEDYEFSPSDVTDRPLSDQVENPKESIEGTNSVTIHETEAVSSNVTDRSYTATSAQVEKLNDDIEQIDLDSFMFKDWDTIYELLPEKLLAKEDKRENPVF